jgi:hypothetical protein
LIIPPLLVNWPLEGIFPVTFSESARSQ